MPKLKSTCGLELGMEVETVGGILDVTAGRNFLHSVVLLWNLVLYSTLSSGGRRIGFLPEIACIYSIESLAQFQLPG